MRILYISDMHLPLGPQESLRPELRKNLRWASRWSEQYLDRFDHKLRVEADQIAGMASEWLDASDHQYDLIINGGDNALPLRRHRDRISATQRMWTSQLNRYGESRLVTLTGNHELGHGYNPEAGSVPDLMNLRQELFSRQINQWGFGYIDLSDAGRLLVIDSEIAWLHLKNPQAPYFQDLNTAMKSFALEASAGSHSLLIATHNTQRARAWIEREGLWGRFWQGGRKIVMLGGHFHIPRTIHQDGSEIFWAGGGSYPEPVMSLLKRMPFTGFHPTGAGAVEVNIDGEAIRAEHRPFSIEVTQLVKAA